MGTRAKNNPPRKRGPKPEVLILAGKWKENVGTAVKKKPPPGGWPKIEKRKGRGK